MAVAPSDEQRIVDALGNTSQLPKDMQMAIANRIEQSFASVPEPQESDWLHQHKERGQTMQSFQNSSLKAVPHGTHRTIYIQPIGDFDNPRAAKLDVILEFGRVFFAGCEVELLPAVKFTLEMRNRLIHDNLQYLTTDIHEFLAKTRPQRDTRKELVCVAVTMSDIYPDESWNFVYGQARMGEHVGVYSFARLDPLFYTRSAAQRNATPLTDAERVIMLRRCVKILLHEVGHLFGLKHCIYYICLMNGANNEKEMDRQPLRLCPVCLRKMHSSLGFDVRSMYQSFAKLCEQHGLNEERDWYEHRLTCLE